jgi:hypothetical protein
MPHALIGVNILRILVGEIQDRDYVSRALNAIIHPLVSARPGR